MCTTIYEAVQSRPIGDHSRAYVGVASNHHVAGNIGDTTIFFGIATHGDWSSLHQVHFEVLIDTDRDGEDDWRLFTDSLPNPRENEDQSDVYHTLLVNR